jgi:hypothetical protein
MTILFVVPAALAAFATDSAGSAGADSTDGLQPREPSAEHRQALGQRPVPLVVESLGIAMYQPASSHAIVHRTAGQTTVTVEDDSDSPQWSMTIQHLHSTLEQPTARGQIDAHLAALREHERDFRVLKNQPYEAGGMAGHLAMIELKTAFDEPYIQGWLILPAGTRVFLVFSVLTLPEALQAVEPVIHACWSTLRFRSAAELSLERRSRIDAGRDFLESITPDQLRRLDGRQIWTRIYRPADPQRDRQETEIGYSLVEVRRGAKGALNPERDPARYRSDEKTEGIIVRIHGRVIADAEREVYYDSQASYWMAWDQSEEAWSVRAVQRQRRASRGETETGLRLPQSVANPRPTLKVIRSGVDEFTREPVEWLVPDVYMSQAIAPLLGYLLPMDSDEPLEMGSYFYNYTQAVPQLTQRIDVWQRAEDDSGNWILTTRLSSDGSPTVSTYSPSRMLIRRTRADGTIIEPSTPEQILRIWQRKGLDTGGGMQRR